MAAKLRALAATPALVAALLLLAPTAPPGEAVGWLVHYLTIDTSNPPGNEQQAAAYLANLLHREGIPTRLHISGAGRANLVARLAATAPDASGRHPGALILLHHLDTVPADPATWTFDPWGGTVHGGDIWGRGAIDDKALGVAQLAAFVELHRRQEPLTRDVVLLATADEETGGERGLAWLLDREPELATGTAAVFTEGGTSRSRGGTPLWWGIEITQKRPLWLELTTHGRSGHGASLDPRSAPAQLVRGLAKLEARPPRPRVTAAARDYLTALAPLHGASMRETVADLPAAELEGRTPAGLAPGLASLFLDTAQITVLAAGDRVNVVPAEARARLDVRLLPDTNAEQWLSDLRRSLGQEIDVQVLLGAPPAPASPTGHWAWNCAAQVLVGEAPVVPAFIAGVTDARHFRERGVPVYGVWPFALDALLMRGVHGDDERIPVAAFEAGVERMKEIVRRCVTP